MKVNLSRLKTSAKKNILIILFLISIVSITLNFLRVIPLQIYLFIGFVWALISRMHELSMYDDFDDNETARGKFIFNLLLWPMEMGYMAYDVLFNEDYNKKD